LLQASDRPFLPVIRTRVRWLAERRLSSMHDIVLLNRSHVVAWVGIE
jgi:hypothetical protein